MDDLTLNWLNCILASRFTTLIKLCNHSDGVNRLYVAGSAAFIDIISDPLTFTRAESSLACCSWNATAEGWFSPLKKPIPAPGAEKLPDLLIKKTDEGYSIGYDILGLIYWILSRQEEVGRTDLDYHGRFPAINSHAFKHGYLERPVVDEWLHILGQVICSTWPDIKLKQHNFQIKLSHDVDHPSKYGFLPAKQLLRTVVGHVFKQNVPEAIRALSVRLKTRNGLVVGDPYNMFDWIMDQSDIHGLKSAFYFICGRTHRMTDADYDPAHPAIRKLIRNIHRRGHEVGLHPSYNTYRNTAAVAAEAARLKCICDEERVKQSQWGGRMHYLRWEQPTTMYGWEESGMDYDSTLGYADHPGFRCGTCHEYPAFDPVKKKMLGLWIRPLIVMEASVIIESYLGLGVSEAAYDKMNSLKQICRTFGGNFTLLWHNSAFETKEQKELYLRLLDS